jgi:hypothetical protein
VVAGSYGERCSEQARCLLFAVLKVCREGHMVRCCRAWLLHCNLFLAASRNCVSSAPTAQQQHLAPTGHACCPCSNPLHLLTA